MPRKEPIQPVQWSPEAQRRLAILTNVVLGAKLGVHPDTVGRWANGRAVTPEGRMSALARNLEIPRGKRLTPADLGRPDLGKQTRLTEAGKA